MEPMKFNCQCHNAASRWSEEPPHSMHSYRVECDRCGKFIKWGAASELHDRVAARDKVTVIQYDPADHQPGANLDAFFE